jgi:hypothetical protein
MSSYSHVSVQVNPEQLEEYPNGVRIQEIELVLGDDPERRRGGHSTRWPARSMLGARASSRSSS